MWPNCGSLFAKGYRNHSIRGFKMLEEVMGFGSREHQSSCGVPCFGALF
jgi:hypothetical protein